MDRPRRRHLRRALPVGPAVALALALTLAGCAASDQASTPPEAPATSEQPQQPQQPEQPEQPDRTRTTDRTEPEPPEVPEVLDFEATAVDGSTFTGASVAGRPVVLWFWAPWCAVCRSQVPELVDLAEQHGDTVAFLGVGSLDSREAIAGFAADVPGVQHLSDPDGALYQRFDIAEQSSFVVLDAEGGEVLRTGYGDSSEVADAVAGLAG